MESDAIKLSYNRGIVNKPSRGEPIPYSVGFRSVEVNIDEFIELIKLGYAFTAQFSNNHRKTENFKCADFIAVDIDSGMTIGDAHE